MESMKKVVTDINNNTKVWREPGSPGATGYTGMANGGLSLIMFSGLDSDEE